MDYKIALGILSVLIGLSGYIVYVWNIFRHGIKPHAFSWLVWGTLMAIGFSIQIVGHAGAGSWAMGLGALACFIIFGLALGKGNRKFGTFDWVCLGLAGLGIVSWTVTKLPLIAAILISLADAIGYLPTFRKGYIVPREENLAPFIIGIVVPFTSMLAIEQYAIASWLYPASLVLTNSIFVTLVLVRRRTIPVRIF